MTDSTTQETTQEPSRRVQYEIPEIPQTIEDLARVNPEGYFVGTITVQKIGDEYLMPPTAINLKAPTNDPVTSEYFYKLNEAKDSWIAIKKPTTAAECIPFGGVSHTSDSFQDAILRALFQTFVYQDPEHYRLVRGEDLSWKVEAIPEKTEEEKLSEAIEEARAKRDQLLADTDYLMASDYPISDEDREKVKVYRQALRDIPEQEGFPYEIIWPEMPEIQKVE